MPSGVATSEPRMPGRLFNSSRTSIMGGPFPRAIERPDGVAAAEDDGARARRAVDLDEQHGVRAREREDGRRGQGDLGFLQRADSEAFRAEDDAVAEARGEVGHLVALRPLLLEDVAVAADELEGGAREG